MKTILVAVDLSRASGRVCRVANELGRAAAARVVLLHVSPPQPIELRGFGFAVADVRGMLQALEKRSARRLRELARRCEKFGGPVRAVERSGEVAATILAEASTLKPEFIVLGSHGRGATYDLLVGSTTQRVLRHARQPVLVVPIRPANRRPKMR